MIGLNISAMEPLHIPEGDGEFADLAFELIQKAAALSGQLRAEVQEELGRLVRSMNCYYSNFIEGHQTQPRDIERALARDFDGNERQRDLQHEAVAHIEVQKSIDFGIDTPDAWPTSEVYV